MPWQTSATVNIPGYIKYNFLPQTQLVSIWSILMNRCHLAWQGVKNKYWNIMKSFGVHIVEGLGYVLVNSP